MSSFGLLLNLITDINSPNIILGYISLYCLFLNIYIIYNFTLVIYRGKVFKTTNVFKYIIILIILSILFLLISEYFCSISNNFVRIAYAEGPYNERLSNLAIEIAQKKYDVIELRLSEKNFQSKVSLADIGWKNDNLNKNVYGVHLDKINLFEKFIDRNPNLQAFDGYYRHDSNNQVYRNLNRVYITKELIKAMATCTDLTI